MSKKPEPITQDMPTPAAPAPQPAPERAPPPDPPKTTVAKLTCVNCPAWVTDKGAVSVGRCHFHAPVPSKLEQAGQVFFPTTKLDDWCWEARQQFAEKR